MRNATKAGPLLFCLSLLSCVIFAETDGKTAREAQEVFAEGQKLFRNSDYAGAIIAFEKYTKLNPDDPKGPWMELKALCFRFRSESSADEIDDDGKARKAKKRPDDVTYTKAMLLTRKVMERVEEKIASGERVGFYQFVAADTYGFRGIFRKAAGRPWTEALDDAERMKELAEKSDYQDAKYLLGIAEYELSLKGWWTIYRIGAPFKGFSSDRKDSFRLIHEAETNNAGPFSDDIRLLMLHIVTDSKTKEKDHRQAEEIFGVKAEDLCRYLKRLYPDNEIVRKYEKNNKRK